MTGFKTFICSCVYFHFHTDDGLSRNRNVCTYCYAHKIMKFITFALVFSFRMDIGVVIYEAMATQCGRSVVQVLVVKVDIGVVTYEAMTPLCRRSVVQVLVVRVDIGMMTYEPMTLQCERSVV